MTDSTTAPHGAPEELDHEQTVDPMRGSRPVKVWLTRGILSIAVAAGVGFGVGSVLPESPNANASQGEQDDVAGVQAVDTGRQALGDFFMALSQMGAREWASANSGALPMDPEVYLLQIDPPDNTSVYLLHDQANTGFFMVVDDLTTGDKYVSGSWSNAPSIVVRELPLAPDESKALGAPDGFDASQRLDIQ